MVTFNSFALDCLNRKAINVLNVIDGLFSDLENGVKKTVPLASFEKTELSFKDFSSLFTTYKAYRKSHKMNDVAFEVVTNKATSLAIGESDTSFDTISIWIESKKSDDVFATVDVPTCYKKRESSAITKNKNKGKNPTENPTENTTSNSVPTDSVPTDSVPTDSVPTPSEELDNEDKALENKANAFNAEVVKDIFEVSIRRIGLTLGVEFDTMTKAQKDSIIDTLKDFAKMLENGSVM